MSCCVGRSTICDSALGRGLLRSLWRRSGRAGCVVGWRGSRLWGLGGRGNGVAVEVLSGGEAYFLVV